MLNKPGVIIILSTLFIGLLLPSCSQYDDPAMSLRSKTARVDGQYVLTDIETDPNQHVPDYLFSADITFMQEGGGEMMIPLQDTVLQSNFQWEFNDEKSKLRIRRYHMHNDTTYFKYVDSIYDLCFCQYQEQYASFLHFVGGNYDKWSVWGGMMEIIELSNDQMRFEYTNDSTDVSANITLKE
ncbi:MAG: hypothetical protein R6V32_05540 [Bacteroidales bacterium]